MMYSTYIGILIIALQCSHVLGDCRHGWLLHGISCYYFSEKSKDWTSASVKRCGQPQQYGQLVCFSVDPKKTSKKEIDINLGRCYGQTQQFGYASCRAHGAELVIVESQGENDFIAGEVKRLKGGFWLDGTDEFSEGMWEWASTGEAMDYTHWFPGEPNDTGNDEDCLLIHDSYPNGEWNDGLCSTHFKYICELKLEEIVVGK